MAEARDWWVPGAAPGSVGAEPPPLTTSVTLVRGSSFVLCDPGGDLRPHTAHGLFVDDTRYLSRWELTLDGHPLEVLASSVADGPRQVFVLRIPPGDEETRLLVHRHRQLGRSLTDRIELSNLTDRPQSVSVRLDFDTDLASLFDVKEGRAHTASWSVASVRRGSVRIDGPDGTPALALRLTGGVLGRFGLTTTVVVPARAASSVTASARPLRRASVRPVPRRGRRTTGRAGGELGACLDRAASDLSALRINDPDVAGAITVAAGAPWFMALFGRDALITSAMTVVSDPALALGTLTILAHHQGRTDDAASEEAPGKILHETRFRSGGPLGHGGRRVYYGSVDSSALFVVLLGEYLRWTDDVDSCRALVPAADAALRWSAGARGRHGFVTYGPSGGLRNQGWRDSWNGVTYADGRLAEPPLALADVQGYHYAALQARAALADRLDDRATARAARRRADDLRAKFEAAYWLPDLGWYALALDPDGRPVDALTSVQGQLLWSGIADPEHADRLAELLVGRELFSGWGVRTLGCTMGAYNPLSYHNGSVWPHDTALAAAGLNRYGKVDEADRLVDGLLDLSSAGDHRLPELISGIDRGAVGLPVPYPTSCVPQAWASAAPALLLRTLLDLSIDHAARTVLVGRRIPARFRPVRLPCTIAGSRATLVVSDEGAARLDTTDERCRVVEAYATVGAR